MTAEEDKKTPARVGRVPGLILAQRWGRPSLAGGVLPYLPAARQMAEEARILGMVSIMLLIPLILHSFYFRTKKAKSLPTKTSRLPGLFRAAGGIVQ